MSTYEKELATIRAWWVDASITQYYGQSEFECYSAMYADTSKSVRDAMTAETFAYALASVSVRPVAHNGRFWIQSGEVQW